MLSCAWSGSSACRQLSFFALVALVQMVLFLGLHALDASFAASYVASCGIALWGWMIYFADDGTRRKRLIFTATAATLFALLPSLMWACHLHGRDASLPGLLSHSTMIRVHLVALPITWVALAYHRVWHVQGSWRVAADAWYEAFWRIFGQKCLVWVILLFGLGGYLLLTSQLAAMGVGLSAWTHHPLTFTLLSVALNAMSVAWVQQDALLTDSLTHLGKALGKGVLALLAGYLVLHGVLWAAASIKHGHMLPVSLPGLLALSVLMTFTMQLLHDPIDSPTCWHACCMRFLRLACLSLLALLVGAWVHAGCHHVVMAHHALCQAGFWVTGIHAYNIASLVFLVLASLWVLILGAWSLMPAYVSRHWWKLQRGAYAVYVLVIFLCLNPMAIHAFSQQQAYEAMKPYCHVLVVKPMPAVAMPPVLSRQPTSTHPVPAVSHEQPPTHPDVKPLQKAQETSDIKAVAEPAKSALPKQAIQPQPEAAKQLSMRDDDAVDRPHKRQTQRPQRPAGRSRMLARHDDLSIRRDQPHTFMA